METAGGDGRGRVFGDNTSRESAAPPTGIDAGEADADAFACNGARRSELGRASPTDAFGAERSCGVGPTPGVGPRTAAIAARPIAGTSGRSSKDVAENVRPSISLAMAWLTRAMPCSPSSGLAYFRNGLMPPSATCTTLLSSSHVLIWPPTVLRISSKTRPDSALIVQVCG